MRRAKQLLLAAAAVLAAAAAGAFLMIGREPLDANAELRAQSPQQFAELSQGTTWYEVSGRADAPAVVLVPGLTLPAESWEGFPAALAAPGLRVVRYDLYGRGYSDRPDADYGLDLYVRQLGELLDALGVKRASLVAESFGAGVAVAFAVRHPERVDRLVLIDPSGLSNTVAPWMKTVCRPVLGDLYFALHARQLLEGSLSKYVAHPALAEVLRPGIERELLTRGFHRAIVSTLRHAPLDGLTDVYEKLGTQPQPILVIWGKEDRIFPFARAGELLKLLPRAKLIPVEGAGHLSYLDQPDVVAGAVRGFLAP